MAKNFKRIQVGSDAINAHRMLPFTTRLSATKVKQIYPSQGNYLQLDKVPRLVSNLS